MPDGTESTVASQVVGPFLLTLNEMWAEWFGSEGVPFHALHPGWADTPGIEDAHGQFWLDRRRSIHKMGRTPIFGYAGASTAAVGNRGRGRWARSGHCRVISRARAVG